MKVQEEWPYFNDNDKKLRFFFPSTYTTFSSPPHPYRRGSFCCFFGHGTLTFYNLRRSNKTDGLTRKDINIDNLLSICLVPSYYYNLSTQ